MTDITLEKQPIRRFDFPRLFSILIRPRQTFSEMAAEPRVAWLTPMLVLTVTAILLVVVAGLFENPRGIAG